MEKWQAYNSSAEWSFQGVDPMVSRLKVSKYAWRVCLQVVCGSHNIEDEIGAIRFNIGLRSAVEQVNDLSLDQADRADHHTLGFLCSSDQDIFRYSACGRCLRFNKIPLRSSICGFHFIYLESKDGPRSCVRHGLPSFICSIGLDCLHTISSTRQQSQGRRKMRRIILV